MRLHLTTACVLTSMLLLGCKTPPPQAVDIPVMHPPPRATNEDVVDRSDNAGPINLVPDNQSLPKSVAGEPTTIAAAPTTTPSAAVAKAYGAENYRLISQPDEIVSVLKNGLTVIIKRMPSPVLSVRGYALTGGVYEGKWLGGGLSHLLEHLVAGGSSQRRTEAQNRDLLQKIGNDSNAYTTTDHTAFFINTTKEHLDDAVDLVTGWMLGALITPNEYKREYQVVQRELEKDKGEPDWVFYDLTQMNRYRVSPQRVPVIGYQEVIQGLSRDDVYGYYKQEYEPNNMVFVVAGDLDPETMLRAVQKNVDEAKPGRVPSKDIAQEPPVLSPRTLVATFPKLGQTRLELAFPTVKLQNRDLYALDLLGTILGGGESSILVQELRDHRQLVTDIEASHPTPTYVEGSFEIDMQLAADKIGQATDATLEILKKVAEQGVTDEQLHSAKVQMRTARLRGIQTSEGMASSLAEDFMNTGDPHFTDLYLEKIDKLTSNDLKAVAKRYFNRQRLITTALVPAESVGAAGLPKAEDLLRKAAPTTREVATSQPASIVTRIELPNGAILLHKQIATSPLVEIHAFALGGLTAEDAADNGIGNLAMQSLPRGTDTRTAQQIAEFFDSIGGTLETGCGNNSWFWNVSCMKGDFAKAMDALGDIVNHPAFKQAEVTQMKKRVEAAIDSEDANWQGQAFRFFKKSYFGPKDSPYQFLPIGQKQTVEKLTADQLRDYYTSHMLKSRRVIAIYGDVDLDTAKEIAIKTLGSGAALDMKSDANTPAFHGSRISQVPSMDIDRVDVQKTDQPLAGIVVGFDSQSVIGDPANDPLTLADAMCSGYGYPTGYVFETLRGLGLVYEADAQNWPGRATKLPGTFIAYAGCDPSKVNQVIDLMLLNIARLQGSEQDMQPGWFERSKQLTTTFEAMENETPSEQATTAALDELYGLGYDYHDRFNDRIDAVKLNQVRNVSARRLSHCVVTISTPAPELVKEKAGMRTYPSFPPVDLTPRGVNHDAKQ